MRREQQVKCMFFCSKFEWLLECVEWSIMAGDLVDVVVVSGVVLLCVDRGRLIIIGGFRGAVLFSSRVRPLEYPTKIILRVQDR